MHAVNLALHEGRGDIPSRTAAELREDCAECSASSAAARTGRRPPPGRSPPGRPAAGYPMLWRQAALALELCQRAAEIAGQILPRSYRPDNRAGNTARMGQGSGATSPRFTSWPVGELFSRAHADDVGALNQAGRRDGNVG
jgi:hypothetical protein